MPFFGKHSITCYEHSITLTLAVLIPVGWEQELARAVSWPKIMM